MPGKGVMTPDSDKGRPIAVVAGNVYDKYNSKNPIERLLVGRFLSRFLGMVDFPEAGSVLEVGCGEGYVAGLIKRRGAGGGVFACDLSAVMVEHAKASSDGVKFFVASAYELPVKRYSMDVVVASEVLEHLDDPARALEEIARVARGYVLVSVPREPLWRLLNVMRGKYLAAAGNTPGHCQHWSARGISELLRGYFDVINVASSLPWTICLCRVRPSG